MSAYAELHSDGSGFIARAVTLKTQPRLLAMEEIVQTAAGILRALSDHANSNTGASGDALAQCSLLFELATDPMQLGWRQNGDWNEWRMARGLERPAVVRPHTVSLDAISQSPVEWLAATRLLVTDLIHAFGVPEVVHLTPEGQINTHYWNSRVLEAWTAVADVPRVTNEIRFR